MAGMRLQETHHHGAWLELPDEMSVSVVDVPGHERFIKNMLAGVGGIGLGLWWADYAAALLISASILHDGFKNTRAAVSALMDKRAMTYDDGEPR